MKPVSDGNVQAIGRAVRALLVGALLAIGLAQSARADTTYTYTGNPFTTFSGGYACPPECEITGSFTLGEALPANFFLAPISPLSYTFTDGNTVWDNTDSTIMLFGVATDPAALFDAYEIILTRDVTYTTQPLVLAVINSPGGMRDVTFIACSTCGPEIGLTFADNVNSPGRWSRAASPVPEPPTPLLLGTGLLGLGIMVLRRKQIA